MAKKRSQDQQMPKTTIGWIVLVIFLLISIWQYVAPQLQQMAQDFEDTPAAQQQTTEQDGSAAGETKSLTVHFLDVGQGDSALLISDGKTMLIDGGDRSAGDGLVEDLRELGITHLDYLVASHSHEDHIGGLPDVLEAVTVSECIMPDDVSTSKIYESFLTGLEEGNVALTVPAPGDEIAFGDCTVTILGPLTVSDEHNENSLVMKVSCGETDYLFTGDMEGKEEEDMVTYCNDLSSEILKVPHHGSEYTCYDTFLDFVAPRIAVISCGEDNSYEHPNQPLLDRLEARELEVYRTDLHGRITCVTTVTGSGSDTVVTCERKGAAG